MKLNFFHQSIIAVGMLYAGHATAQDITYTNFVRQVQYPTGVATDVNAAPIGENQKSELAIDPGGARFELWTVDSNAKSYLLSNTYVGTYTPVAEVSIVSEDKTSTVLRTRADRPFTVNVMVTGLHVIATDPEASKSINFYHHVQSYGTKGTGLNIDRTQAILSTQSSVTKSMLNADEMLNPMTFSVTSIPAANRAKVWGEERFSAFSLRDYRDASYDIPPSQLDSKTIQIWPVADGSITGITEGQMIEFALPQLTLTLNDLYPNSTTYVQAYKGDPRLGVEGKVVPGSAVVVNDSVPNDRTLIVSNYDSVFDSDGRWTMELVTVTPFGIDRLAYVSFDVDRTLEMNGNITTLE